MRATEQSMIEVRSTRVAPACAAGTARGERGDRRRLSVFLRGGAWAAGEYPSDCHPQRVERCQTCTVINIRNVRHEQYLLCS